MATATKNKRDNNEPPEGPMEQRFGIEIPYSITLYLRGVRPFLFNRMDIEAYDAEEGPGGKRKPRARPEYETMVWRDENGQLALPVENVIGSISSAGKYFKSPISSSGSATPTLREALVPNAEYASFGVDGWDTVDFRLARYGDMKRTPKPTYRPRLEIGWLLTVPLSIVTPELYGPLRLLEITTKAGSVMGVGDGRKIGLGRYVLDHYEIEEGLPW